MLRVVGLGIVLASCKGGGSEGGACDLLEGLSCPECLDGIYTCTYGDIQVSGEACGGCQTQAEVYEELCDRGSDAPAETVEASTECVLDEAR